MQPIVLVQLISKQTTPNLYAAMALRPTRIIHCCTPCMQSGDENLKRAYRAAGITANVQTEQLSRMPQVMEVRKLVETIINEASMPVVVNFTCGTKLMSLGAFAGALKRACSLYVDTDDGLFIDGGTAPGFVDLFVGGDTSLSHVKRQLRVDILAIANGCGRVTNGRDWQPYRDVAELLLMDEKLEDACHRVATGVLEKTSRDFKKNHLFWKDKIAINLDFPDAICLLAEQAGLLEGHSDGYRIHHVYTEKLLALNPDDAPWKYFEAFNRVSFPFTFFQGVWWEVAVVRYLSEKGCCRDLRWSVQAGDKGTGNTDMEEDVLGIDNGSLLYVSCKRGGHKERLSRTIEDINSSAQRIGGSFSRKMLALCIPPSGRLMAQMGSRCADLGIDLLTRRDVLG